MIKKAEEEAAGEDSKETRIEDVDTKISLQGNSSTQVSTTAVKESDE